MPDTLQPYQRYTLIRTIAICALGYFIDVFDIQLFGILRVPSLIDMGVPPNQIAITGGNILNAQMAGMIIGGVLWGFLGDQFGRLKALYGSILIYSMGTLACAFVSDPFTYGLLRLFTGFGLAGETGATVTIVAEMMTPTKRTWGVAVIACIGYLGPVTAIIISWFMPWKTTYMIAGLLGLSIFAIRINLLEPDLFLKLRPDSGDRNPLSTICEARQLRAAITCVLAGLPLTYGWFILNFFSQEIGKYVLVPNSSFNRNFCLISFFVGTAFGDSLTAFLSQAINSRRNALLIFSIFGCVFSIGMLLFGLYRGLSTGVYYSLYFMIGMSSGAWAMMSLFFAENFGTDIRATATICLSNALRATSIPLIFFLNYLQKYVNIAQASIILGICVYAAGLHAVTRLRETHALSLDYTTRLTRAAVPETADN